MNSHNKSLSNHNSMESNVGVTHCIYTCAAVETVAFSTLVSQPYTTACSTTNFIYEHENIYQL
jgi:hypothetical protein